MIRVSAGSGLLSIEIEVHVAVIQMWPSIRFVNRILHGTAVFLYLAIKDGNGHFVVYYR